MQTGKENIKSQSVACVQVYGPEFHIKLINHVNAGSSLMLEVVSC